ncbi:chloride intracellular channel protein 5-like [Brassica rapa]|uniref:Uncharacterized protein n=2 Tax=Brassica TaxID=3705 RepID=M4CYU0_BRACM|nr:chloride intracellular channel protein 5-like [Brassica rapa]XP_013737486.2 flocculation protein FLO11-like [Brassica napus]CAF2354305.1 unnamed protein product [Brassica napus]
MINLRIPILVSFMFFLVFISSSLLFATPIFAARIGHSLVQEEATKIPQYNRLEESEEPEIPEEPEEPEIPEDPEEPEEPPKESEEESFEFPSWIPSFPFPGTNGGLPKTEKTKPTSVISEETSSGSNKKP